MERFVASGFGIGLLARRMWGSDAGAGTFGAALAAAIALLVYRGPIVWHLILAAAAVALSLWSPRRFSRDHEDPGWIVIDEVAGTLVALIGLGGIPWVVALVVARVADITKALPGIRAAERWPGARGITADDVLAGLYGSAVGWSLTLIL